MNKEEALLWVHNAPRRELEGFCLCYGIAWRGLSTEQLRRELQSKIQGVSEDWTTYDPAYFEARAEEENQSIHPPPPASQPRPVRQREGRNRPMTSPTIAIRDERPIRNILLTAIVVLLVGLGIYVIFIRDNGVSTNKVYGLISDERARLGFTVNKDGQVVINPDGLTNQVIIQRIADERARLGYKVNDDGSISLDPNGIIQKGIDAVDTTTITPEWLNCIIDVTQTERETGTDLDPAASCANK